MFFGKSMVNRWLWRNFGLYIVHNLYMEVSLVLDLLINENSLRIFLSPSRVDDFLDSYLLSLMMWPTLHLLNLFPMVSYLHMANLFCCEYCSCWFFLGNIFLVISLSNSLEAIEVHYKRQTFIVELFTLAPQNHSCERLYIAKRVVYLGVITFFIYTWWVFIV